MERKGRTNLLQSLFFILVILLAGFFLLHSTVFEIRHVEVKGNDFLEEAKIVELSGITLGTNIFKQNLGEAGEKIQLHPMVKKVGLNRRFPSTVQVILEERKPLALVPFAQGFIQIDEDGYYLSKSDFNGQVNLPYITGLKSFKGAPGTKIDSQPLAAALTYLKNMPENLRDQVSEINAPAENELVLYTVMGIPVKLGDVERCQEKINLLHELNSMKDSDRIEYLDLSITKPVIKYLEPEKPGG